VRLMVAFALEEKLSFATNFYNWKRIFLKNCNKNVISIEKGCKWPLLITNNIFFHNVIAHNKWELLHLDVKMSFLNNDLKEYMFMNQTKGFQVEGQEHKVCKLHKTNCMGFGKHLKPSTKNWHYIIYLKREG
jgi:hypothetical protein